MATATVYGIVQRNMLWIFVSVVTVSQLIPLFLAEEHCEKPICYVVKEIDSRNHQIINIDCNDADKYKPAKIIRYRCASDFSISDLLQVIEPEPATTDTKPPKNKLSSHSSVKPVSSLSGNIQTLSSTSDLLSSSVGTTGSSTHLGTTTSSSTPSDGTTGSSTPPDAAESVTEQYIFTFLATKGTQTTKIFIGTRFTDVGASGIISFPLLDIPNMTFSLKPGSGKIITIPSIAVPSEDKLNQILNTTVKITANEEVSVYGHQNGAFRATAFSVRKIKDLGTDYWVITHQSNGISQVGVVATENHTNITINGMYFNSALNLNKYETFYFGGSYDLTGTHIIADKPIFVLAGNSADEAPNPNAFIDSFYECFPSVTDWGRYFNLVPFPKSTQPFTVKILSSHAHCIIRYVLGDGSLAEVTLGKGEVINVQSSDVMNITASEVILVAQFAKGETGYDKRGKPSMLLTPPYGRASRNEFVFPVFRLAGDNNETKYMDVWLPPEGQTSDLLLDNKTVAWQKIHEGSNGYSIVRSSLSSHQSHIIQSKVNITAVVHGIGHYQFHSYSLL